MEAIRAIGTVGEIGEGKFLLEVSKDLVFKVIGDPGKLKVGDKAEIIGAMNPVEQGRQMEITDAEAKKVAKTAESGATAKVEAKVFRSHTHLQRKAGRAPLGFGTIVWGPNKPGEGKFLSYAAFDPLSTDLRYGKRDPQGRIEEPPAEQGAIMRLIGEVRRRYFTSGGKPGTRIEILANPLGTKVLKAAEFEDPFAGTKFASAEEPADVDSEVPF